jgi:hypothetical protein
VVCLNVKYLDFAVGGMCQVALHTEERFPLNTIRPYAPVLWAIAVLVSAPSNQASGQQSNKTGSLILVVTDADDKQLLIVYTASLTSRNAGSPILCNPDNDGLAHFRNISAGRYRLKVSSIGYFPEFIDSLTVYADSVVTLSIPLHSYNGLTEFDAYEDLAKGIVRIYRTEWFLGPGATANSKYGFRIELKCCDPTFKFDRYNAVVYKHLDSLNGPGWYDAYLRDLWSAKVTSDSISKQLNK